MKRFLAILLTVMLLAGVLSAPALAETKKVYVSSTGSGTLNLRSGPGKGYEVKGYVHHGDKVTPLDHSGEWSKVKTASGKKGWIKTKYIDGTTKALGTGKKTVKVSSGASLNLRSGPGTGYSIKGEVKNGATVKVLNTEDEWVKVTVSSSGKTGWIMAKYIGGSSSSSSSGSGKSSSGKSSSGTSVYRVKGASLNMRKGAGTSYGLVTTLHAGTPLKLISTSGNWAKVKTFSGKTGWVSRTYITSGATATVTASSLNVRASASASAKLVTSLGYGKKVTVTSITGNWAKVTVGKKKGYVSMNFLDF